MIAIQHDYTTPEQQHILGAFNKCKVKYIGFDAFALNSYTPTLPFGNIQLWVKPTAENFESIKNAIKLATGHNNRLVIRRKTEEFLIHDNPDNHFMEIGFSNRKIQIFPIIPGIAVDEFDTVLTNATLRKAGVVNTKILSPKDAHRSILVSKNRHKDKFIQQLERAFPEEFSKKANVDRKPFVKKDFNYLIQNVDIELALENLGFLLKKEKSGNAQHVWSRNSDDRKIVVFLNQGNTKGYFDVNDAQSKGTVIDLLIREFNGKWIEVFEFCDKLLLNPLSANLNTPQTQKKNIESLKIVSIEEQTKIREKSIRENNDIMPYQKPQYLNERSIKNEVIYSPEFLGQINNIPYKKGEITYYNTAFPMRNEYGLTNFIVRFNNNFNRDSESKSQNKYYLRGEKLDAIWMSNELFKTTQKMSGKHLNFPSPIQLPADVLGVLHKIEKDGVAKHYFTFKSEFLDKETKDLLNLKPNSTVQVLVENEKGFEKVKAGKIIITESPIDAISYAQMFANASDNFLYIATGGHPSPSQIDLINRTIRNHGSEVILAMDNETSGLRFNINLAGGIQHPSINPSNDFSFKIDYVNNNQYLASTNASISSHLKGECHLSISFNTSDEFQKEKTDTIISQVCQYVGSFLNKDTVKLFEEISTANKQIYRIAVPNNTNQLKRAIDILLETRRTLSSLPNSLFRIQKPILKDWNDDLIFGKKQLFQDLSDTSLNQENTKRRLKI